MEVRKTTLLIGAFVSIGSLLFLMRPKDYGKMELKHITVPASAWQEIQVSLNDYPLHNEEFEVEVNNSGIITKVHAQQQPFKDLLLHRQTIPYVDAEGRLDHYNAKLNYQDRKLEGLRSFRLAVEGE